MFIDTHCHLIYEGLIERESQILEDAKQNRVGKMICVSAHSDDFLAIDEITKKYENIYGSLGVHPDYADQEIDYDLMKTLANGNKKIVGVGETGLDYYEEKNHSEEMKKSQAKVFIKHIDLAKTLNLPVIIHTRDAAADTENILKTEYKKSEFKAVMHCYTGSWESTKNLLDLGFYFSASGILTFKNADRVRETFSKIPMDRIVIETDSPYCAPVPFRGKTNEPAFVVETAKVLAGVKNLDISELETILENNSNKLFNGLKNTND